MTEPLAKLTPRQSEILELVAKGFTNIEIGELLDLSAGTVKVHVSAIIDRLDVSNRTEAATIWLRERLSDYLSSNRKDADTEDYGAVCVLPFSESVGGGGDDTAANQLAFRAWSDIRDVLRRNDLRVIDGQTASAIAQAGLSQELIRENLGAAYVVKGSLSAGADGDFVLNIECYNTANAQTALSSIYDTDPSAPDVTFLDAAIDLIKSMQSDAPQTARAEASGAIHTEKEKSAQEEFWRGRYAFSLRTPESLLKSCEHFQAAITAKDDFTEAYVGLANAAHQIGYYGEAAQSFFYEMGRQAAHKAVSLDPHSASAHCAVAYSQFIADWNFSDSEKSFERARLLDADYDEALMWFSLHSIIVGKKEQALTFAEEGLSKNPMAIPHFVHIGHVHRSQGRLAEAIEHLNIAVEMDPTHIRANIWLALTHADKGEFDVAGKYAERLLNANGRFSTLLGIAGYIVGLSGNKKKARKLIAEIKTLPGSETFGALYVAFCLIGIGEHDEALEWIWKALGQRPPLLLGWGCDPIYERLRSHDDFAAVANGIGLPPEVL